MKGMRQLTQNRRISIERNASSCKLNPTSTKRRTAADDDPNADSSTLPIPSESVDRKRSADASCISQGRPRQSDPVIRTAVASPPRSPVHPPPHSSGRSSHCGATVPRSRSSTSSPAAPAVVQSIVAADLFSPPPFLSPPSNAPMSALDSSCPTAARYLAASALSAASLLPLSPPQR
jgi:hypothetical protein